MIKDIIHVTGICYFVICISEFNKCEFNVKNVIYKLLDLLLLRKKYFEWV